VFNKAAYVEGASNKVHLHRGGYIYHLNPEEDTVRRGYDSIATIQYEDKLRSRPDVVPTLATGVFQPQHEVINMRDRCLKKSATPARMVALSADGAMA